MDGKLLAYWGCLVVILAMFSPNVVANDLQTTIVATRIMPGDNASDNSSDMCLFSTQLDLVNDTAYRAGYAYHSLSVGNFTGSS